jgi:hypothetical protein
MIRALQMSSFARTEVLLRSRQGQLQSRSRDALAWRKGSNCSKHPGHVCRDLVYCSSPELRLKVIFRCLDGVSRRMKNEPSLSMRSVARLNSPLLGNAGANYYLQIRPCQFDSFPGDCSFALIRRNWLRAREVNQNRNGADLRGRRSRFYLSTGSPLSALQAEQTAVYSALRSARHFSPSFGRSW